MGHRQYWWLSNCPCQDCISRLCSGRRIRRSHPRQSFRCLPRLLCAGIGLSGALMVLVAVQLSVLGLYLPPVLKLKVLPSPPQTIISTARPYRGVKVSRCRRVVDGRSCPVIQCQIISATSVEEVAGRHDSAPDDHFTAGPYRGVGDSR